MINSLSLWVWWSLFLPIHGNFDLLNLLFSLTFLLSFLLFSDCSLIVLELSSWFFFYFRDISSVFLIFFLTVLFIFLSIFKPIPNGLFRGCSRMEGRAKKFPLPKICHTYSKLMKLGTLIPYLKKIHYMNHVTYSLISPDIGIFYQNSLNFAISRNTDIDSI